MTSSFTKRTFRFFPLIDTPITKRYILFCRLYETLVSKSILINVNFSTDEVQYLGHVFSSRGVCLNSDKVEAITSTPAPLNIKKIQAFLGMCNYYFKFIPNFATVLAPLYDLLKKNVPFHWGPEQHGCFVRIKGCSSLTCF